MGVDIGCGMRILNLGKLHDIDFHAFHEHIRGNVPSGMIVREDRFGFKPLVGEEMEIYREAKQLVTELYCYREIKDSGRINKAIGSLGGGITSLSWTKTMRGMFTLSSIQGHVTLANKWPTYIRQKL